MSSRWPLSLVLCALSACGSAGTDARAPEAEGSAEGPEQGEADAGGPLRVAVFTRTLGFRHDSIPEAIEALLALDARTFSFTFTEDPDALVAALRESDVVAFVSTSGDVLDAEQERAFERFVRAGGGFVGVHSASDTEHDWPFYAELVGALFASHPAVQPAHVLVEATAHPTVQFLPASWSRTDEWYNFLQNPRPQVQVLLRLDEDSYQGGTQGTDHPIAWCHAVDSGRAFYTALGHTAESWSDPLFVRHVAEGLRWAGTR